MIFSLTEWNFFDIMKITSKIFLKGGKMKTIIKKVEKLVINPKTQEWCCLPYPDHLNGCPKYDCSEKCPPGYHLIGQVLDIEKPIYIVAIRFNLGAQSRRMKTLHPDWTDRQCRCLLYWQGTVNKRLKQEVNKVLVNKKLGNIVEFNPEGAGVNVTLTCFYSDIKLEWPPRKYVYKLALVGFAKK